MAKSNEKAFDYAKLTAEEKKTYQAMAKAKGFKVNAETGKIEAVPEAMKVYRNDVKGVLITTASIINVMLEKGGEESRLVLRFGSPVPFLSPQTLEWEDSHGTRLGDSADKFFIKAGVAKITKLGETDKAAVLALLEDNLTVDIEVYVSENDTYGYGSSMRIKPQMNKDLREMVNMTVEDLRESDGKVF